MILISIFFSHSPQGKIKFFNKSSLIKFVGVGCQLLNFGWHPVHLPVLSHLPVNYLTMSQHSSFLAVDKNKLMKERVRMEKVKKCDKRPNSNATVPSTNYDITIGDFLIRSC